MAGPKSHDVGLSDNQRLVVGSTGGRPQLGTVYDRIGTTRFKVRSVVKTYRQRNRRGTHNLNVKVAHRAPILSHQWRRLGLSHAAAAYPATMTVNVMAPVPARGPAQKLRRGATAVMTAMASVVRAVRV